MDLTIPIKAVGKERPRFHPQFKYAYTPKKTKDFENQIATHFSIYMRNNGFEMEEGAVCVDITVFNKIPNSWTKKRKRDALMGDIRPIRTPDGDNILKAILDGLNDVAYIDDKQVVQFHFNRLYDEEDLINIKINPL
jgi:Holliday junction resolvase RusA-like endonuclease